MAVRAFSQERWRNMERSWIQVTESFLDFQEIQAYH